MPLHCSHHIESLLIRFLFRPALVLALLAGTALALTQPPGGTLGSLNDKVQHLLGFAVLGLLADYSIPSARGAYWRWQLPLLLGYGALIEVAQSFVPYRSADLLDLAADAAGLLAYGAVRPLLAMLWRPRWSPE